MVVPSLVESIYQIVVIEQGIFVRLLFYRATMGKMRKAGMLFVG